MVVWSHTSDAPEQLFSRRKLKGEDWASLQRFDIPKLSPQSIVSSGAFAQSSDGTAVMMWTDRRDEANGVSSFSCESSRFSPANGWSRNNPIGENCYADGSVVANVRGDFAIGYVTPMPPQQLVVVPYFAQNLGAARVLATGPNLDRGTFSLSIGNDRTIRAVYVGGTDDHALYEAEASAQGDWAPVTRIASVSACESACPLQSRVQSERRWNSRVAAGRR
jgi:hypothetical protein